MDFNQLITAVVTNGIGAVCAAAMLWFSWFRETRTIPRMLETFVALMREERAVFGHQHEENRSRLDRINVEQRETRHYIRDLAHQLGLRQAVEAERKKVLEKDGGDPD